ncbi:MAG: hypothetical protein M1826_003855 [Phylliscum demangeonii]|nr:MAG: hypothetical protein M1826_003855 [Phylliscum demangeonii]
MIGIRLSHAAWLLLSCAASLSLAQNVNFTACYVNKVLKLDVNDTSDPRQNFKYDLTGQNRIDRRPYLSPLGCTELCGSGYELWPATDTLKRFGFFLLPLILLAGRFAYAPVAFSSIFWTFVHLLGDPVDSLWSILTRQEKARRNYHLAVEIAPGAPREVAAIWTAYDQWWQDPIKHFLRQLQRRDPVRREADPDDRYYASRQPTVPVAAPPDFARVGGGRRNVDVPALLTAHEIYYIKRAAHGLALHRSTPLVLSWLAIATFLTSIAIAYIRTADPRANNQTSHTLAVVMLFSFLIFAVYISGHVGNFEAQEKVIEEITNLHERLPDLFPMPACKELRETESSTFGDEYLRKQSWAGLNSSWRPQKRLEACDASDRSRWFLLGVSAWVVLVAWATALTLSYLTPVKGFGCRSATWTGIMLAWLLSAVLDSAIAAVARVVGPNASAGKRAQRVWRTVCFKDSLVALASLGMVVTAQIGYMNSCWCRSSIIFPRNPRTALIDLGDVTPDQRALDWLQWLIIPLAGLLLLLAAIFVTSYGGENGRLLFTRTASERLAEAKALKNMRVRLELRSRPPLSRLPYSFRDDELSAPLAPGPGPASAPGPYTRPPTATGHDYTHTDLDDYADPDHDPDLDLDLDLDHTAHPHHRLPVSQFEAQALLPLTLHAGRHSHSPSRTGRRVSENDLSIRPTSTFTSHAPPLASGRFPSAEAEEGPSRRPGPAPPAEPGSARPLSSASLPTPGYVSLDAVVAVESVESVVPRPATGAPSVHGGDGSR